MDFDFDNLNLDDLKNEYNNPVSLEVQKLASIINELSKEMNTYFKTNQFEKGEKAFDKLSSVVMRSQEAFTSCDLVVDDSNDYYSRYGEKLELDESSSEDKKIINVNDYIDLLKYGGEMAIVGLPPAELKQSIDLARLIFAGGKKVYGSMIGGIKETQEMLDFSLEHKIYPETEIISANQIDEAYNKLTTGQAKFRYVIDMKTL